MATTKEELLTLLADNTAGDISAEDMRDIVSALFGNVSTPPEYAEGEAYYNDGVLNIMGENSDVILRVGREHHMKVVNNTGDDIVGGKAVRHNGVTGGNVQIVLALADSFQNATILGVTAHTIPDGETGILNTFGIIENIDMSDHDVGVPLYLSDTTAGDFTATAPVIRTQIGGAIEKHETTGKLFVTFVNNIPLPVMLGSLLTATAPTSIPLDLVNGTPITDYSESIEIVTQVNEITGIITAPLDGIYRLNISLHMVFDNVGGAGKKEIYIDLVDITADTTTKSLQGFILKDAETQSMTDNGAVTLIAGHEYRLEIRSELALTGFSFSSSTFYIESIL